MSVLSDMSNDDLEQIYYAASRQFPSSFDGLRAVADAAIAADRAARAEPVGWWLHVKRHDAHYFAISEQERKGMEVLADQDDKIVPIYTAPPAAPVVPDGCVVVPVKPTEEMLESARLATESEGLTTTTWLRNCVYRAMLAASQQDADKAQGVAS